MREKPPSFFDLEPMLLVEENQKVCSLVRTLTTRCCTWRQIDLVVMVDEASGDIMGAAHRSKT